MRSKYFKLLFAIFFAVMLVAVLISCEKEEENVELPSLTTEPVTEITYESAKCGGFIISDGGADITERGILWDTVPSPTFQRRLAIDYAGSGTGQFECTLSNLSPGTTYYVRAYASNSEGTSYGNEHSFMTKSLYTVGDGVYDVENNYYPTVIINGTEWMAENLKVTKYRDGTPIPTGLGYMEWENTTSGAYAIYPHEYVQGINSEEEMINAYGAYYNWYAVSNNRGLCPEGWRVPTGPDPWEDWGSLIEYLGGVEIAGGKLKSTTTDPDNHPRWEKPNNEASNLSGLSLMPSGGRARYGTYTNPGHFGYYWSSSEDIFNNYPFRFSVIYLNATIDIAIQYKNFGFSVRCVRD